MADFGAVLRKTLENMGETTPEIRARVYEKARATVQRQIDAMTTQPSQAAIDRQFDKLNSAIAEIEADFSGAAVEAPVEPDPIVEAVQEESAPPAVEEPEVEAEAPDQTEEVVDSAEDSPQPEEAAAVPADEAEIEEAEAVAEPEADAEQSDVVEEPPLEEANSNSFEMFVDKATEAQEAADNAVESAVDDVAEAASETDDAIAAAIAGVDVEPQNVEMPKADTDPLADFIASEVAAEPAQADSLSEPADPVLGEARVETDGVEPLPGVASDAPGAEADISPEPKPESPDAANDAGAAPVAEKSGGGRKALPLLLLLAAAGAGGYFAYENREQISGYWNANVAPLISGTSSQTGEDDVSDENGVPVRTVTTTDVETPAQDEPAETETTTAPESVATDSDAPTKFTQRLTEDGTEVDEGPAQEQAGVSISGEGSSVSEQTAGTAQPVEEAAPAEESAVEEVAEEAAPLVGQRAIFYEERTGTQEGTAIAGATVWSVVNEEPGGDLPVEPAIRAETSVPELGLTMEMTIRRNGDTTFPASHIIEIFFRVPESFAGRGIADVQRVTFKTNEQDPGNALIAVPAPIDENIFLIALTDAQTAVATNLQLMERENWIDIPMQYTSGRRALITLEKGEKGNEVFQEVFAAWNAAPIE